MACVNCRAEVQAGDRFCAQCGTAQPARCPACLATTPPGARFCPHCGSRQGAAVAPPPPLVPDQPPSAGPERRHMTVMFCDLAGSTALAAKLDPEDYHQLVNVYYAIVAAEVARFDGFVARHVGDGVLVYFGHPLAHEDDSERAIRAGLAIAARLEAPVRADAPACPVRVGIATGLVVVDVIGHGSGTERTISGTTPNLAARLQGVARPGAVVVAPSTYDLVSEVFEFRDCGAHDLKGLDTVRVREVIRPRSRDDRRKASFARSTPLIGRSDEIDLLLRRWGAALAGEGCCVLLSGDPGIGKSRIVQALTDRLVEARPRTIYLHGSAHHEESALFPVVSALGQAAGLFAEDGPEARAAKAAAHFGDAAGLATAERAVLADLAAGDVTCAGDRTVAPRHRMERRLDALLAHVRALARREPVLMVVEDAHWIDPSSREFIRQLVEGATTLRILVVVTARPDFQPDWLGLAQATLLHVNRLNRREGAALVRQVTGSAALPREIVEEMVDRADGVPLFLEELTKTVVEGARGTDDAPTAPPGRASIPPTLQASLLARLDRLSAARELAQEAASLGREFALDVIAAVTDRAEEELTSALAQLELAGLLLRRGLPPRTSYYFKHALVQDAAYETLTRPKREALHRRIADIYEARFPDIVEARPEILAHHLQEGNCEARAVEAWLKASTRAIERGALAEAVAQLRRALALIGHLADDEVRARLELRLQLPLGNALMAARGYTDAETEAAFGRARQLCETLGDTDQLMRIAWGQFTGCFAGGQLAFALAGAEEILVLAERRQDAAGLQLGHASAGAALLHLGRLAEGEAQLRSALDLTVPDARATAFLFGQSGRVTALAYLGLLTALAEDFRGAAALSAEAVAHARHIGHAPTLCFARSVACRTAFLCDDHLALAALAAQVSREAEEHGLTLWRALGTIYRGWSEAQAGRPEDAALSIRRGLADYRAIGAGLSTGLYLATLGTLEARLGHHRTGLELLEEARREAEAAGEAWIMPEIQRRLGEALAGVEQPARAEAELRAGLSLAQRDGTALWRSRLAESLDRSSADSTAIV